MDRREILRWLREEDPGRLEALWKAADQARRENVGDEVHLRGLVEFSNHCARSCGYCGLRAGNPKISRYRMTREEIIGCARQAARFGYGTVVLQSGEDPQIEAQWMAEVIRAIKSETPLAVTLSLGERSAQEFEQWRRAGADRYLLRFETSNRSLYERIHPPLNGRPTDRIALLGILRSMGYEIGSGMMAGIPGQTYEDLAEDILTIQRLDLDMIGLGPYIAHPQTPLGSLTALHQAPPEEQAPAIEEITYKLIALARLAVKTANIPSTTALATLNRSEGRELGLARGANVVMPNLTPPQYRVHYEIYPAKACIYETAEECNTCLKRRIHALGRKIGAGRGDSQRRILSAAAGRG